MQTDCGVIQYVCYGNSSSGRREKNPFGLEPAVRSAAVPGAVDAASTVGETGTKGDPFGFKRFGEPQVAAPQIVEKAVIDDVSKYVATAIEGGNLQDLLNLGHIHWIQIDRNTLKAIRNALGDPNQKDLADWLQGRIGAAESRLFSEEMKTKKSSSVFPHS